MANRIPWDQAETALLIDTYNQVETGQISMREAVPRLLRTLRQRALNAGIIIDDIYRNENGIQMMLGKIRYLMTGGKSGLPNTSRLFLNMVTLYQTDSSAFERTLKAAKEPAAIELPTKETFYEWLRGQEEERPKQLQSFVEETDAYARKSGLLSDSLLDIQDIGQIERLQEAIRSNLLH